MLPILILVLLLALDFGRVFFGWVALQNAARIGANAAAAHPDHWSGGGSDAVYYTKMAQDLQALNCNADFNNDGVIDSSDLPAPAFVDPADSTAYPYDNGDEVTVTLQCDMSFLTPLVGALIGNPLRIQATSTFAVFGGVIEGVLPPPDPIPAGCIGVDKQVPNLVGRSVASARQAWTAAGFTGAFNPSTGSDTDIVQTQTTTPVTTPGSCAVYTATVNVTHTARAGLHGHRGEHSRPRRPDRLQRPPGMDQCRLQRRLRPAERHQHRHRLCPDHHPGHERRRLRRSDDAGDGHAMRRRCAPRLLHHDPAARLHAGRRAERLPDGRLHRSLHHQPQQAELEGQEAVPDRRPDIRVHREPDSEAGEQAMRRLHGGARSAGRRSSSSP